ncbi:hypothetical protein D3C87_2025530 [compost metagenome]
MLARVPFVLGDGRRCAPEHRQGASSLPVARLGLEARTAWMSVVPAMALGVGPQARCVTS